MSHTIRKFVRTVLQERVRSTNTEFSQNKKFKFEEFKKLNSINDVFNYAKNRLEYVAHGSSRCVFVMTGNKVLKVALNTAGIAQNEQEIEVFTNPKTKAITTKIFDSDSNFLWIVCETVKPFEDDVEIEHFLDLGVIHDWQVTFEEFIDASVRGNLIFLDSVERVRHRDTEDLKRLAHAVHDLVKTSNMGLATGDLKKPDSWGRASDGRVVLLDFGFTEDIASQFYDEHGAVLEQ